MPDFGYTPQCQSGVVMLNRIARTFLLFLAASFLTAQVISAQAMDKKEVKNASDLPRFTYPVKGSASELAQADDATFNAFAAKVRADLDSVFATTTFRTGQRCGSCLRPNSACRSLPESTRLDLKPLSRSDRLKTSLQRS